ncbi:hypothetical protein MMC28_000933 [Mycoblastus sanguinarius]|nr:hypothetical protein [Mycoblastus sanguinarius]
MSQGNDATSGSKRRREFTHADRPGSYSIPFPRQLDAFSSSEGSLSPRSTREEQLPKAIGLSSLNSQRVTSSFEANLPHTKIPLEAASFSNTPPLSSPTRQSVYTLPPIRLSIPRTESYNVQHDGLSRADQHTLDNPTLLTLQHDNTTLVSAGFEAQSQIANLDKIVQASGAENQKLAKERRRLKAKIDVLEAQVEELHHSMELSQKHAAAKDAQYLQIVEMSARLQTQGESETQKGKVDYEQWALERKNMQEIIGSLRTEVRNLRRSCNCPPHASQERSDNQAGAVEGDHDDTMANTSSFELRDQMKLLQRANTSMGGVLDGVQQEHIQLAECIEQLGNVGRNMQVHLKNARAGRYRPGVPESERSK